MKMSLRKILSTIFFSTFATIFFNVADATPNDASRQVIVRAVLDTTQATMGDRLWWRVEVLKNGHYGTPVDLQRPEDGKVVEINGVEIRELTIDSATLQNGRIRVRYNFMIQPFEPGNIVLPKFKYAVGTDTFSSEITSLKVVEPPIPQLMLDSLYINPMEGVITIPARWYDVIPSWWYWVVIGVALAALGVTIVLLYRRNGPGLLPVKKTIPPYQLAMQRLEALRKSRLTEAGREKEYFTELTDILRQYLGSRFHIFALEMSTTQIMDQISANDETKPFVDQLQYVLDTADFVKFAKVRTLPDENKRAYDNVLQFVEKTKPLEQEPGKNSHKNSRH